jgi:hypothetical protein
MMMMPGGMPGFDPNPQQQVPQLDINAVPARVRLAMDFIAMLHAKQMKRGAVADGSSQVLELDGLDLTPEEESARDNACLMMGHYFEGKLTADKTEELRLKAIELRLEKDQLEIKMTQEVHEVHLAGHARQQEQGHTGPVVSCPVCHGNQGMPCKLCKGAGKVMMVPLLNGGEIVTESQQGPGGMMGGMPTGPIGAMLAAAMMSAAKDMAEGNAAGPSDPKEGPEGSAPE